MRFSPEGIQTPNPLRPYGWDEGFVRGLEAEARMLAQGQAPDVEASQMEESNRLFDGVIDHLPLPGRRFAVGILAPVAGLVGAGAASAQSGAKATGPNKTPNAITNSVNPFGMEPLASPFGEFSRSTVFAPKANENKQTKESNRPYYWHTVGRDPLWTSKDGRKGVSNPEDFVEMATSAKGRECARLSKLPTAVWGQFIEKVRAGEYSDYADQPGTHYKTMCFGVGKVSVIPNVVWAGDKPLRGRQVAVDYGGKRYIIKTPDGCANVTVEVEKEITPPPPPPPAKKKPPVYLRNICETPDLANLGADGTCPSSDPRRHQGFMIRYQLGKNRQFNTTWYNADPESKRGMLLGSCTVGNLVTTIEILPPNWAFWPSEKPKINPKTHTQMVTKSQICKVGGVFFVDKKNQVKPTVQSIPHAHIVFEKDAQITTEDEKGNVLKTDPVPLQGGEFSFWENQNNIRTGADFPNAATGSTVNLDPRSPDGKGYVGGTKVDVCEEQNPDGTGTSTMEGFSGFSPIGFWPNQILNCAEVVVTPVQAAQGDTIVLKILDGKIVIQKSPPPPPPTEKQCPPGTHGTPPNCVKDLPPPPPPPGTKATPDGVNTGGFNSLNYAINW